MKRIYTIIILMAAALACILSASCQRDPIIYPTSDYYVAVKVNAETSDSTRPTMYAVNFYDTLTHKLVISTYIKADTHPAGLPDGGYVTGLTPGVYDLLVYNFDTRVSSVTNTDYLSQAYAHSSVAGYTNNVPVILAPDHLYSYCERVEVPYITAEDGTYIIETVLDPRVEDWTVIVYGIKNLDLAQSIMFFLGGQTAGTMLGPVKKLTERGIVMFPGETRMSQEYTPVDSPSTKSGEGLIIYTPYTTFGKLDEDMRCMMTIQLTGPNGSVYYGQVDVTDQILDQQDKDHVIIIDSDIEVKPREDGGFNPLVDPWDPDVTTIVLE